MPVIRQYPDCQLLDVGCGWNYRLLEEIKPFIKRGIGIDFKAEKYEDDKIKTMTMTNISSTAFCDQDFLDMQGRNYYSSATIK